jgi:hypothetical protein
MKKTIISFRFFLLLALALTATAASADWVRIGSRGVSDSLDHDTLVVGADEGQFSAIRIEVHKRAVQFHDLKIHYVNGGVQDVSLRDVIPAGGSTRVIDLQGDDRKIARIELWYDAQTVRKHKGGRITIFGRR